MENENMPQFQLTESSKALLDKMFQESLVGPDVLRSEYEYLSQIQSLEKRLTDLESKAADLEKYRSAYDKVKREKDLLAQNASTLQIKASQSEELSQMVDRLKQEINQLKGEIRAIQSLRSITLEGFYQYLKGICQRRTNLFSSHQKVVIVVQATAVDSRGSPSSPSMMFRMERSNSNDAKITASRF